MKEKNEKDREKYQKNEKWSINNNQITVEIKKKEIEILMINKKWDFLKEEFKNINEKLHKTENISNDFYDTEGGKGRKRIITDARKSYQIMI